MGSLEMRWQFSVARKQLRALDMGRDEYILLRIKLNYYAGENKEGRLLARCLRSQALQQGVAEKKLSESIVLQQNEQIAAEFAGFHTALYSAEEINDDSIDAFLDAVPLSSIPLESAICLDRDITTAEVPMAIQRLKPGKAPGHDGFGAEFYRVFETLLDRVLAWSYNEISSTSSLAIEGKDPKGSSYCPYLS
ncbi:hypothetical protein NDU88_001304 [Pleurodeles waltl]|uniref:Reverse transcriptase n=1 Tax=Pleurodeles waltl TaxID=8319 RepID=A0AAV7M047_PLEWA|nr:hypothetical protein NDU88_001304 [Pleurodeles waltl]